MTSGVLPVRCSEREAGDGRRQGRRRFPERSDLTGAGTLRRPRLRARPSRADGLPGSGRCRRGLRPPRFAGRAASRLRCRACAFARTSRRFCGQSSATVGPWPSSALRYCRPRPRCQPARRRLEMPRSIRPYPLARRPTRSLDALPARIATSAIRSTIDADLLVIALRRGRAASERRDLLGARRRAASAASCGAPRPRSGSRAKPGQTLLAHAHGALRCPARRARRAGRSAGRRRRARSAARPAAPFGSPPPSARRAPRSPGAARGSRRRDARARPPPRAPGSAATASTSTSPTSAAARRARRRSRSARPSASTPAAASRGARARALDGARRRARARSRQRAGGGR